MYHLMFQLHFIKIILLIIKVILYLNESNVIKLIFNFSSLGSLKVNKLKFNSRVNYMKS